ncbi:hypothetical protein GCM10023162_34410 [Klenkia terrae]
MRHLLGGQVGRLALTVAVVVVVFAGVMPQVADYGQAWGLVTSLTGSEVVLLTVVGVVNLVSFAPLWVASAPGLTWGRALLADQASTAVANAVPVGFAFGVGTTAAMFSSFGFSPAVTTRSIGLTGIWNSLVKLTMPVLSLAGVLLVGHPSGGLAVAAVLGGAALLAGVGVLVAELTHRRSGDRLAGGAQRLAGWAAGRVGRTAPTAWAERLDRFRVDSLELLRHRWGRLSLAALGSHVALFLVLLACLRTIGGAASQLPWVVALAVFSVTRLVTILPVTPGALGVAELSYVAGLTAVGVGAGEAAGAVLVFRFLTWFVSIPLGLAAWVLWRHGLGRVAVAGP